MKTTERLNVEVTYTVELGNVEIPDKVYNAMLKITGDGGRVPSPTECYVSNQYGLSCVTDWLADNVSESEALDIEYEINAME